MKNVFEGPISRLSTDKEIINETENRSTETAIANEKK